MRGICFAVAVALVTGACDKTSTSVSTESVDCTLIGVTISPPSATLHPGDTLRPVASFPTCPATGANSSLARWRSSDTTVATVDSIAGLIHAKVGGDASIIAADANNRAVQGALVLRVVP